MAGQHFYQVLDESGRPVVEFLCDHTLIIGDATTKGGDPQLEILVNRQVVTVFLYKAMGDITIRHEILEC